MMRCLLLAVIFLSLGLQQTHPAHANVHKYGYIRIQVVQVNSEHRSPVELKSNGAYLASFSHSMSTPLIVPLEHQHLATNSYQTPMSSSYARLDPKCKFKYQVQFSLSPVGPWIQLGQYEAPTQSVNTALPIGLCGDDRICSMDQQVAKGIEQIREKIAIEAIQDWLDNAMREEKRLNQATEARNSELLAKKASEEAFAELFDKAVASEPALSTDVAQETEEVTDPHSGANIEAMIAHAEHKSSQDLDGIFRKIFENEPLSLAQYHAYIEQGPVVDLTLQMAVCLANAFKVAAGSTPYNRDVYSIKVDLTTAEFLQLKMTQAGVAGSIMKVGIAYTPLGDAIDLCEATSGKEYCLPSGRELSIGERSLSFVGVLASVGNRKLLQEAIEKLDIPWLKKIFLESEEILHSSISRNGKNLLSLTPAQQARVHKITNVIENHATEADFLGVLKERLGERIPTGGGKYYDHIQEMENSLRGLRKHVGALQRSADSPSIQPEIKEFIQHTIDHAKQVIHHMDQALHAPID